MTLNYTFSYLESIKTAYNISGIVITGDLVDDGTNTTQWKQYANARGKTTIPLYEVTGNHDVIGATDNFDTYIGTGKRNWTADIGDLLFIGIGYTGAALSSSDIAQYSALIDSRPSEIPLFATHYYFNGITYDAGGSALGSSIKSNLVRHDPTLVMCGHMHGTILHSGDYNGNVLVEDMTDYQTYGNYSAGRLYTVYNSAGKVTGITVRDFTILPSQSIGPELVVYQDSTANQEIIDAHNAYRNEVGDVPLTYDNTLAAGAQAWAEHDANIGSLEHSSPDGQYGENIARWTVGYASWTDIVNLWGAEKSFFIYGPFGDGSSTTGHWYDVGHYTQIVWNTTTQCGCGKATNVSQNAEYFVCRYIPPGNIWGRFPYLKIVSLSSHVGLYRQSTGIFFLKNSNSAGDADYVFQYGAGGNDWSPLVGDWDGDGTETVGLYQTSIGAFFVKNSNGPGNADLVFPYGAGGADWVQLSGDWDGDDHDTVGAYQKSIGVFFLKNTNSAGPADIAFQYGAGGNDWSPLVGDWDGDGRDTVGLYQTSTGTFFLKNSNSAGNADLAFPYGAGGADWVQLSGDWDGDGHDTVGAYQKSIGVFFLKNSNTYGNADNQFQFGTGGNDLVPIVGRWG